MRDPQTAGDYTRRQTDAAHRVLVDLAQVLATFGDCMVLVGGWVPDLLLPDAEEPHVGSLDIDLALDAQKLTDGRYADLLKLLTGTGRYIRGGKPFQMQTRVDLHDGLPEVTVEVDFLAPDGKRLKGGRRLPGFRVLQAVGCAAAFRAPETIAVSGEMIDGTRNTVRVRVAAIPDFLIMKCHALAGRDKPKDAYDIVYCLDHAPAGRQVIAGIWREQLDNPIMERAAAILREKFASVDSYGPQRAAQFLGHEDPEILATHARRAFEIVQDFLRVFSSIR